MVQLCIAKTIHLAHLGILFIYMRPRHRSLFLLYPQEEDVKQHVIYLVWFVVATTVILVLFVLLRDRKCLRLKVRGGGREVDILSDSHSSTNKTIKYTGRKLRHFLC